jgi:hypothetical protein
MASIPRLRGGQALSSYNSPPAVPEDGGREAQAPPYSQPSVISEQFAWPTLLALDSDELFDRYRHAFALRPNRYERNGCAVNEQDAYCAVDGRHGCARCFGRVFLAASH